MKLGDRDEHLKSVPAHLQHAVSTSCLLPCKESATHPVAIKSSMSSPPEIWNPRNNEPR